MNPVRENGVNMLAVKKQNRSSILQLIHHMGSLSRKEIAVRLGLTPAAITMITGELLEEGLLCQIESEKDKSSNRKGRREVLLQINGKRFAALGVSITPQKFRVLCMDLDNNILFENLVYTGDCRGKSSAILERIIEMVQEKLQEYDVQSSRTVVGLGVSISGEVDSRRGVSVNSFPIWEERQVPVADILAERLKIPVLLTNHICALTHGESMLSKQLPSSSALFIQYGPGLCAARSLGEGKTSVFDYKDISLGHMIVEPNGAPCVCGNQGCLETILHYDSIENTLKGLLNEARTPILWDLVAGDYSRVTVQEIISAYDSEEPVVEQTLERVIFYLSLMIKNVLTLFDLESVVLYGDLFENKKFSGEVQRQLARYLHTGQVSFSHNNGNLETFGPAAMVVSLFFEDGGVIEPLVD